MRSNRIPNLLLTIFFAILVILFGFFVVKNTYAQTCSGSGTRIKSDATCRQTCSVDATCEQNCSKMNASCVQNCTTCNWWCDYVESLYGTSTCGGDSCQRESIVTRSHCVISATDCTVVSYTNPPTTYTSGGCTGGGGSTPTNTPTPVPCTNACTVDDTKCDGKDLQTCKTGTNGCTYWETKTDAPACTHYGCFDKSCILKANSPGDTTNTCDDNHPCPGANTPTPTPTPDSSGCSRTATQLCGGSKGCCILPLTCQDKDASGVGTCKKPPPVTLTNTPTPTPAVTCTWGYKLFKDCVSCRCSFHWECSTVAGSNSATCAAAGAKDGDSCNNPSSPYSITNTPSNTGFRVTLTTNPSSPVGSGVPVTFTAQVSAISPGDPKAGGMPSDLLYTFFWNCESDIIGLCKPLSGAESNIRPDPGQCISASFGEVCRTTPTGSTDTVSRTHTYTIAGSWYNATVMAEKTPPQLCSNYGESCGSGCCSGLSCQPSSGSFPTCRYPGSDAETNAPIYVSCVAVPITPTLTSTPTPTPTPAPVSPWIKLVDTSFTGVSNLYNPIPTLIKKFNGDDPGNRVFIDVNTGSDPGEAVGPSINTGSADVSSKKWKTDGVTFNPQIGVSSFISYLKSRKNYTDISVTQDLKAGITGGNGIYVAEGNRTIRDDGTINQDNIVLIVVGDLTITKNKFNPSKHTVAILVTGDIILDPGVSELDGIFIVDGKVNAGGGTNGLEVVGNLIVKKGFTSNRSQTDNRYPSVLIKFDPSSYRSLLSYLSIRVYDWTQLTNK